MKGCNVVFLDPDNGLEVASCSKPYQSKAGKYVYYPEVLDFFQGKDALVIYQHLCRKGHRDQIQDRAITLKKEVPTASSVFAIRFKPYSPRAYFILCSPASRDSIRTGLQAFLDSRWRKHWDCFMEIGE